MAITVGRFVSLMLFCTFSRPRDHMLSQVCLHFVKSVTLFQSSAAAAARRIGKEQEKTQALLQQPSDSSSPSPFLNAKKKALN